ncbi:MAG: M20/M25/M40 family metallo-hydrolase, partial [Marinirhabdus sp.]|nr:M20/M25/M40 family metallo-hydrolase [Marinirhabdus sp.]
MKFLSGLLSFILVVFIIWYSFHSLMPASGADVDAPTTEFSAERALIPLQEIAKAPHYHGSEEHKRVRDYLVRQLQVLGLETEIQEGFVLDESSGGLDRPKNIIGVWKGSGSGKSLVLLSHYDSAKVPSLGASDAGSGIVTILESLRAYKAAGKQPKNDIVVLFTDAEEIGLDGARLFVNEHPLAKNAGLVLNFEARGSGGPSNMILETNGGNANLVKAFLDANTEFPVASSLMYSVYKLLPNDTDSTVFREDGDIDSYFFAFIDDHFDYHTANDTIENLDINTLQHQGSHLL